MFGTNYIVQNTTLLYLVTCCSNVMVENVDPFQTSRIGLFSAMSDGTTKNGAPVYETESGQQLWYLGLTGWILGPNHTNTLVGGFLTPVSHSYQIKNKM